MYRYDLHIQIATPVGASSNQQVSDGLCSAAQIANAEQDSLLRILRDTQLWAPVAMAKKTWVEGTGKSKGS